MNDLNCHYTCYSTHVSVTVSPITQSEDNSDKPIGMQLVVTWS